MPYSLSDLEHEITCKIELEKAAGNNEIMADWVAHAVIADHAEIEGADKDFYTVCGYRTVREAVRKVMGAYKKGEVADELQQILEGFEVLQTHYVVARGPGNDKQQSMVHISAMTFNELTIKALEHDVMSLSHAKHRDELYRYRDSKFQNLSNAA